MSPAGRPGSRDFASRALLISRQRRRGGRHGRLRRLARTGLKVGAALAAVAGLATTGRVATHWLGTTPALAVTRLEVVGARRVPEDTVRQAAGLEPGVNILVLDPAAVAGRVQALPGISRVQVVRHLPDRVTIVVAEREPYALLNPGPAAIPAGRPLVWIDADGYLVSSEDRPGVPGQPILTGAQPARGAGDPLEVQRLRSGLGLLRVLLRVGPRLAARVSEIDVTRADDPVLYTVDGAAIRMGDQEWEERLARLDGVLAELDTRGQRVASVDLRFRDLLVYVPREPVAREASTPGGPGMPPARPARPRSQP